MGESKDHIYMLSWRKQLLVISTCLLPLLALPINGEGDDENFADQDGADDDLVDEDGGKLC